MRKNCWSYSGRSPFASLGHCPSISTRSFISAKIFHFLCSCVVAYILICHISISQRLIVVMLCLGPNARFIIYLIKRNMYTSMFKNSWRSNMFRMAYICIFTHTCVCVNTTVCVCVLMSISPCEYSTHSPMSCICCLHRFVCEYVRTCFCWNSRLYGNLTRCSKYYILIYKLHLVNRPPIFTINIWTASCLKHYIVKL